MTILNISCVNTAPPTDPGTFDAYVSAEDYTFRPIVPGEVIEMVAPGRLRIKVNNFAGWATDDPRLMWADTDFGERYHLDSTDDPDIPPELRKPTTDAGYYPGLVCGHSMRGTDMLGNQVLTGTYTGGPGAVGTIDQTVTIFVTDELVSDTVSFTVRLVHPDVYYLDRNKSTYAVSAPEPDRAGIIYISRDGDFTGALPAQPQTTTEGGVEYMTFPDGRFGDFSLQNGDLGWAGSSSQWPGCVSIRFKAGETFFSTSMLDPERYGFHSTHTTWTHPGSSTPAIIEPTFLNYHCNPNDADAIIGSNGFVYHGHRVTNLHLNVSGYDPSDTNWTDWTNILKYTNKTGTIVENSESNQFQDYNGDILDNGAGIYVQVIADDGVDTLTVRQVVDTSAAPSPTDINDKACVEAAFTDGQTLTNQGATGSVEFVAAGSRQDRTKKTPAAGIALFGLKGTLFDGLLFTGASTGINGLGRGSVVSNSRIKNSWNYGAQWTGSGDRGWFEISYVGLIITQPLGFEGPPRYFGGASVANNRNLWNVTWGEIAEGVFEPTTPTTNDVSHSFMRCSQIFNGSMHYSGGRWFGGHGGGHQPMMRLATSGADLEYQVAFQIYGCFFQGGGRQFQFNLAGLDGVPYTPEFIRLENTHFRGDFCSDGYNGTVNFSNFIAQNNLFEIPNATDANIDRNNESFGFFTGAGAGPFTPDPDVNSVNPIVQYNTFIAQIGGFCDFPVRDEYTTDLRNFNWTWFNNAYAIDATQFTGIDGTRGTLNDDPVTFYDATFHPLPTAKAYQSATGTPPRLDFEKTARPASLVSSGGLEPT